jgi:hypothetical protein
VAAGAVADAEAGAGAFDSVLVSEELLSAGADSEAGSLLLAA